MLGHDFAEMPQGLTAMMLLRCRFCLKTPTTAREDGCPKRELEEVGLIPLSAWNPEGLIRFEGRNCLTCDAPIMGHELRRGSGLYWCHPNQNVWSEGIEGTWDADGVAVPEEPRPRDLPQNN